MAETKQSKEEVFVGLKLTPDLLKKLDAKVDSLKTETGTGNRSQVIRTAIIEYLR